MIKDSWSDQRDLICLNCARRIVAPRRSRSKYGPLREYLWRRGNFTRIVTLSFSRIEGIIKTDLPLSALRSEDWWRKNETTAQGYAWRIAGWNVQSVDLKERTVTFRKISAARLSAPRRRPRKKAVQRAFTPVPPRPRRPRKPSKTRVSRVLARARNVQRKRITTSYSGKLKKKSVYEKRLYKSDAKPSVED
jgi:hypothetical protein